MQEKRKTGLTFEYLLVIRFEKAANKQQIIRIIKVQILKDGESQTKKGRASNILEKSCKEKKIVITIVYS